MIYVAPSLQNKQAVRAWPVEVRNRFSAMRVYEHDLKPIYHAHQMTSLTPRSCWNVLKAAGAATW